MSIDEDELRVARTKPIYKAGIWAFRIMLAVLIVQFVLMVTGVVGRSFGAVGIWFILAYAAAGISGYVLLDRAGVRIFGLSEGIWSRRRMVYRDILGLSQR